MIKVSDITGKPVISIADARNPGYVAGVWLDGKLLFAKTVEILCDEDEMPERAFAPFRSVSWGEDAAILKSQSAVTEINSPSAVIMPLNLRCYNTDGKFLGCVRDVEIDGSAVKRILCDDKTLAPEKLVSASADTLIFNDTDKPFKLPKVTKQNKTHKKSVEKTEPPAAHAPILAPEQNISAPQKQSSTVQTPVIPQSVTVTHTPGLPTKDYSFLMGKPVHSPIVSQGRVLIPSGVVVDERVIEYARRENKLVQLALQAY